MRHGGHQGRRGMGRRGGGRPGGGRAARRGTDIEPESLVALKPDELTFRPYRQHLALTIAEQRSVLRIDAVPAFPVTAPDSYIQLNEVDFNGRRGEPIGIIADLGRLSREGRALLASCLRRTSLVPVITAIVTCQTRKRRVVWEVETDRGPCTFEMSDAFRGVDRQANDRAVLTDEAGNQYEIPRLADLDPRSRKFINQYS